MILARPLAVACYLFLLFSAASAQHTETWPDASQYTDQHAFTLDSSAADSTGILLVVPNVFTPNGDGIHDHIEVATDGVSVFEFTIYSRAGTRIFRSFSPRIFWDGTNNSGIEMKEGVYYYVLEEEGDDPYSDAGIIYLFR
jgi:gliding motility-associated-like protein